MYKIDLMDMFELRQRKSGQFTLFELARQKDFDGHENPTESRKLETKLAKLSLRKRKRTKRLRGHSRKTKPSGSGSTKNRQNYQMEQYEDCSGWDTEVRVSSDSDTTRKCGADAHFRPRGKLAHDDMDTMDSTEFVPPPLKRQNAMVPVYPEEPKNPCPRLWKIHSNLQV